MLTRYMDVNFNKYSNDSFLTFVCTVFISSKKHIQTLNRSSKAGAALVKTITKSPDEWATTKQACGDELVAYLPGPGPTKTSSFQKDLQRFSVQAAAYVDKNRS